MPPSAPAPLTCGRAMLRRAGSSARVRARRSYSTLYGVQQLLPPRVVCAPRVEHGVEPGIFTLTRGGTHDVSQFLSSLCTPTHVPRRPDEPCHRHAKSHESTSFFVSSQSYFSSYFTLQSTLYTVLYTHALNPLSQHSRAFLLFIHKETKAVHTEHA